MAPHRDEGRRWSARPWRARGVRLLVYALPILLSLGFVHFATKIVPPPTSSLWVFLAWWGAVSLTATAVVSVVFGLARRLLPLGALLELSLVFPDRAPSRFQVALRTGTVESLEERLALMRAARDAQTTQEAAEILLALVGALSVHDRITRGHAERVRAYSAMLGAQLGLPEDELDRLNWAALLHDIGKLEVDPEILNKDGRPTDEEWESLRLHPLHGEKLVEPLREWLGDWLDAVGHHHERWDGTGYPRGVPGEEIPPAGRIVAIADVFDVITSTRSYKQASTHEEARAELVRSSGSHFDPRLVRSFLDLSLDKMRLAVGPLSWLAHAPLLARLPFTPSIGSVLGGAAAVVAATTTVLAPPIGASDAAALPEIKRPAAETPAPETSTPATTRKASKTRVVREHPRTKNPPPQAPRVPGTPRSPGGGATGEPGEPTLPTETPRPSDPAGPSGADEPREPAPPKPPTPRDDPEPPAPPPPPPSSPPPPPPTTPQPSDPKPPPPPPPPLPNQPPTFAAGGNQTALEDGGGQSVGWASSIAPGPAGESSQNVTFDVSNGNPGLFAAQPAVGAGGTLTYTPAPNAFGSATVTVVARDDGGSANGGDDTSDPVAFTITVEAVNDAPSFNGGGNQTVISLLGAQSVSGWASGISPGPANESGQTVTFVVSTDRPELFAVQPAVSPDGTLTYRPKALALGTATVTVRAVDSGGTANGGSNTSAPQSCTITII